MVQWVIQFVAYGAVLKLYQLTLSFYCLFTDADQCPKTALLRRAMGASCEVTAVCRRGTERHVPLFSTGACTNNENLKTICHNYYMTAPQSQLIIDGPCRSIGAAQIPSQIYWPDPICKGKNVLCIQLVCSTSTAQVNAQTFIT